MPHRQGTRDTVTIVLQNSTSTLSVRLTALRARQLSSQTFLLVLMAHAGSCWPRCLHSRQHTMQPGKPTDSLFPRPSLLFSRFGVLQPLPPRRQRWANLDIRIRTYTRICATTYSIGQDCTLRSHTISDPTLDHAPSDAPKSSRPRPAAVCLSACRTSVTEKRKCRCLVLREKAD